jgi:hypothetical protein
MSDIQIIIDRYIAAWNQPDEPSRTLSMAAVVADNCYYADAHLPDALTDRSAHDRFVNVFRTKFPEFSLKLATIPQSHHGYFRFGWQLVKPDGTVFTQGVYFGEIDPEGKINKIIGFVDPASS